MAAARPESARSPSVPRDAAPLAGRRQEAVLLRLVRRLVARRVVEWPVPRAVGSGVCQAVARRGVPMAAVQCSLVEPLQEPAAQERRQQVACRQQAASCRAEARLSVLHSAQAKALRRRVGASPVDASVLRLRAHAAALPAETAKRAVSAGVAASAQREAVPQPAERAGAAVLRGAVPRLEAAEAALVAGAVPQQGAAKAGAAVGLLPEVVEAEPGAAVVVLLGVVAAERGAAAGPQPEAVVAAERDGAVRPRAVEPGAAGLRQAVLPLAPPSASVCRPGRLRPLALPPAPRSVVRSARRRRSLQSAAPKWRWWQAAQDEV
jgi:hypothetical protein